MFHLNPSLRGHGPDVQFFFCFLLSFVAFCARAQNKYPMAGDALIHGLTIGTGPGSSSSGNTALGAGVLQANTSGVLNLGIGPGALGYNITGNLNTACGNAALQFSQTGSNNTGFGAFALVNNGTGNGNTALGNMALSNNGAGNSNVGVGTYSLYSAFGSNLVAVGDSTLFNNYNASGNTAIGSKALYATTSGGGNTALGIQGLYNNTTGGGNAAVGAYSMYFNSTGSYNTAYGMEALLNNTSGTNNTAVGAIAGPNTGTLTNTTAIGFGATAGSSNSVVIGNSSVTSIGGNVGWSSFSDGRFKRNIVRNVPGLAFINKLTPITYTLDVEGIEAARQKTAVAAGVAPGAGMLNGPSGAGLSRVSADPAMKQAMKEKSSVVYTGFVAQDVDKAAQSIGYNFSGVDKPKDDQQSFYGLRYSEFVVPLVKAVQELSVQNDSLQRVNAQLTARLDRVEQLLGIKAVDGGNSSTVALTSGRLFQNVPNPFNGSTVINYYLPAGFTTAMLEISSMNGERIRSIALSGAGAGQVSVQTAQLASGTYVYSLFVDGNLVDTKRMVVVK